MADLNALIAQGYQFQPLPDPFAQYGKMQQLQQGEQANQLNQMKMQEYQRGIQEQNQLRGLDPSSPTYINEVTKINPKLGFEIGKLRQEGENAKLEFKTKNTALLKNKIDMLPEAYAKADTPEAYIALHESIHADPELGPWLKSIGATKEQGRAKINEAIANGTFDNLRIGSMQKVEDVVAHLADVAYAQSKGAPRTAPAPQGQPAPGAVPMGAPNISVAPLVPMPAEPMVAPAVMGLNAAQARAELAVAPNALAPQVAPVNALAAAPTVDRVKQIDADLLKGNTSKYKNSTGWKDEKKILETERAELVKLTPEITNMKTLGYPLTTAGYTAFKDAQRQDRLLNPAEEAQKVRIALASRPPGGAATPAAPVAVVGTDGKIKYVSREEAISKGMTPASAMEGLSPKEIQNREAKLPQAKQSVATVSATMNQIEATVDRLLANEKGLNGITGFIGGRTLAVTNESRKAEADIKQLKNLAFVQGLTELRAASSTGAGVGNVSNKEGDRFENLKSSLEQTQSTDDLIASLKRLKSQSQATRDSVNQAFEDTYAYRTNAPAVAAKPSGGGAPPPPPGFKPD